MRGAARRSLTRRLKPASLCGVPTLRPSLKSARLVAAGLALIAVCGCAWIGNLLDPPPRFDLQAHRGGRGLAPENTLTAFRNAIAIGVDTLETDLAMTSDGVLVLAHDPYLNPALVRDADGRWLPAKGPPIHSLRWQDLRRYDIGRIDPDSAYAKLYPLQRPADGERFATLDDLIALVKNSGRRLRLNIETKLEPGDAPGATPDPRRFAQAVLQTIRAAGIERSVTIQSFDWRTLLEVRKLAPQVRTACLTARTGNFDTLAPAPDRASAWHAGLVANDHGGSLPGLVRAAGCDVWSMFWRNLTAQDFALAKSLGLKVIPWTVNEIEDMKRLIALGVDGIITDYPDRLRSAMHQSGLKAP